MSPASAVGEMIATDSDRPVDCYIVDKSIVELEKERHYHKKETNRFLMSSHGSER